MLDSAATQFKVVAHRTDGALIKGYAADLPESYRKSLEGRLPPAPLTEPLELRVISDAKTVTIQIKDLKALFFVKSFEGSTEYNETKFFQAHPLLEGLWVRVKFSDNESTEGVIYNSLHYIVDPGFFLQPPDPHGNNEIVYVLKNSLIDFRILGVRNTY